MSEMVETAKATSDDDKTASGAPAPAEKASAPAAPAKAAEPGPGLQKINEFFRSILTFSEKIFFKE